MTEEKTVNNQNLSSSQGISKILVIGGGIAGIQSALDLANSGFFVYLVDRKPSIGGTMAQLDKTFPTNDCSMCILSPKLVDAGRHPNIDVITYAEIDNVKGGIGNFTVTIKKKPRYVDVDKCKNCGDCSDVCPVLSSNIFEEGLSMRHAIYQMFPQANPNTYVIDKTGEPPCRAVCPLHINVQGYIALISVGKYQEAYELVKEKNPFPGITGRICTRPCEDVCRRGDIDSPIAIDYLKRFLADRKNSSVNSCFKKIPESGKKVAIVGSGPAGLLAAYDLSLKGYTTTIFESLPVAGGMLAVGIPPYRLPKDILEKEIETVKKLGVKIKTNTTIGEDISISDLHKKGYNAIFIAVGAHSVHKLGISGESLDGVFSAIDFLKCFNLKENIKVGQKNIIIGGGDAAIDAARTALRIAQQQYGKQSRVDIVYRRTYKEMPAHKDEILEAEKEGIKIHFLSSPIRIHGKKGNVTAVECQRMKLGEPDETGRRRPVPIKNLTFTLQADMVLSAIGQKTNLTFLSDCCTIDLSKKETIKVDPVTLETSVKGIFAGGDAVTGPKTYIEAMSAGRRAAASIDRFLRGKDLHKNREKEHLYPDYVTIDIENEVPLPREKTIMLSLGCRKGSFAEIDKGFGEKKAQREAARCLNCGGCSECMECLKACEPEAIFHDMKEKTITFDVGSIILATGFDEFQPSIKPELGYKQFPNVISNIELERILSSSGPFQGRIIRPSDGQVPKKIAWIQCVGSRDPHVHRGYCSSICCMASVKEAVIVKEHFPTIDSTIFYMDMRAFGKDFEKYMERAEKEYDVKFIRSRISHIVEATKTQSLQITYETDDGALKKDVFDMIVLAVGLDPPQDIKRLSNILGIQLNQYGFTVTHPFKPFETTREGIYVAGASAGPKDIPETVAQASAAAAISSVHLANSRGRYIRTKEYPAEIDICGKPPRVGVFICHCGSNIGGYIDIEKIVDSAKHLSSVVYVEKNLYTCSQDTQDHIKDMIHKYSLNRVVVASCTPRTHEPLFQDTIKEAGLNPYLFEMANIRDQCSWVHMEKKGEATNKAKALIRMAVSKSLLLTPLPLVKLPVNPRCLVIGGGVAGLAASLTIADHGYEVYLLEKEKKLGGHLNNINSTLDGHQIIDFLQSLIKRVRNHKNITIFTDARINSIEGYIGNYSTKINCSILEKELQHGTIIVCTGAKEYQPTEYFYGSNNRVVTQRELENFLHSEKIKIKKNMNFVMIQCIGSRNENHPYCSRICCSEAIKNALTIKKLHRDANVYVLFRDIRTYGFREDYYQKARELGVIFIRFTNDNKPKIYKEGDTLRTLVYDSLIDDTILIRTDILALSSGIVAPNDNNELAQLLKVPLNDDGFYLEAHAKLRPVDFSTEGIFLAGLSHSPQFIGECISQANAAASRAMGIMTKPFLEIPGIVTEVNSDKCSGCGLCQEVCGYNSIELISLEKNETNVTVAQVNSALCKGCGACIGACLSGAIQQRGFTDGQILTMIKAVNTDT